MTAAGYSGSRPGAEMGPPKKVGPARRAVAAFAVTAPRFVSLNGSHRSPYAHQAAMDTWRRAAAAAITDDTLAVEPPVVITATVRRTRNARQDAHNVLPSIKACIDAAVDAGVIPDDDDTVVRALVIEAGPKAATPTIELRIEAA